MSVLQNILEILARILGKTETCPREDKGASSGGQRRVLPTTEPRSPEEQKTP